MMTDIQIKYWDYKEGARHNLAYETENNRHNVRTEGQQDVNLVEMVRHNKASENIGQQQASASMMQASASLSQAETAARNADTNRLVGMSSIGLNESRTTAQNISNEIEGYGLDTKRQLSEVDAASRSLNLASETKFKLFQSLNGFGGTLAKLAR